MKKLTLDPEALRVQSLPTLAEAPAHAAGFTRPYLCDPLTVRNC